MTARLFKRLFVALVVLVGLGALALWWISGRGFSAREQPTAIEAAVALRLRGLATPRDAARLRNPVAASPETIRAGLEHFADHCAICHGNDGRGDTTIGRGLYPKPPDLRAEGTRRLSDGELFYIIENGVRLTGMPAFGGPDSDPMETWPLVVFIRHLPQITAEELSRMEDLNPRNPEEVRQQIDEEQFLEGRSTPPATQAHTHKHN